MVVFKKDKKQEVKSSNLLDVYYWGPPSSQTFFAGGISRGSIQKQQEHFRIMMWNSKGRIKKTLAKSWVEAYNEANDYYIAEFIAQ